MKAVLKRQVSDSKQTLGTLVLLNALGQQIFTCKTLELPDLNNQKRVSCIPKGTFTITPRTSPKYGLHYLVNDVKNRDAILIHHGNYNRDILGCILVGATHADIDGDGFKDVTSSKATLKQLIAHAPAGFTLTIE